MVKLVSTIRNDVSMNLADFALLKHCGEASVSVVLASRAAVVHMQPVAPGGRNEAVFGLSTDSESTGANGREPSLRPCQ